MDGMFRSLFEKVLVQIYPCTIEDVQSKGQKELRIINSIEPLVSNHKLVIDYEYLNRYATEAINKPDRIAYSFVHQYTHLTRDRNCLIHDDRVDALALACEYIKHLVVVDSDSLLKALEEREMDKFLAEKIYGKYSPSNNTYISNYKFTKIGKW